MWGARHRAPGTGPRLSGMIPGVTGARLWGSEDKTLGSGFRGARVV